MKRLTDRQVAVLAAVERLGRATLPDLRYEFPDLAPSTVLDALKKKGLVESSGKREWAYLGVGGFGAPSIAPETSCASVDATALTPPMDEVNAVRRGDLELDGDPVVYVRLGHRLLDGE
jgi:hypothetical protein